jgi:hypothetical protein
MVFVRPYLNKMYFVPLPYFQAYILDHFVYSVIYNQSSIFGRKDQMIHKYGYITTLMYINTHVSILYYIRRKQRGIIS